MIDPDMPAKPPSNRPKGRPESYARIIAPPLGLLAVMLGLVLYHAWPRPQPPTPPESNSRVIAREVAADPSSATPEARAMVEVAPQPIDEPAVAPPPPKPAPVLDQAAVARAESAVDQASRERAHAEARLADAERALQVATLQAAKDLADSKKIGSKVRDPSARISAASSKGGFLKGERDRFKRELAALERVPQTKAHPLMAKSAVAKPTEGTEYHFEVRRNRVAFVDLDRLVEMVKTDAKLRLRTGGLRGLVASTVGPVGSFSLRYEMGRSVPEPLAEMLNQSSMTYNLMGWEIVSDGPNRGETLETTRSPSSSYARAVHRLNPERDTITMWIYPDGFALYRQLRDDLHAHGFLVAARPLPAGTTIKGSPSGSLSAGQ